MRSNRFLVALLFLSVSLSFAKDKKAPLPSTEELAAISARGRALYEYDQAAWRATDALQSLNPPRESLGRYISQKTDAGWVVAFGHLSEKKDTFELAYEIRHDGATGKFAVRTIRPPKPETGFYLAAANAVDTALADFRGEQRPYNVAVLPADAGQLFVYVYPAITKKGIIPLGGDVRYLVSNDGLKIVEKRQLHKTILEIPAERAQVQVVGGSHSHVMSDIPEDTDVFYVLMRHLPEYVGAGGHVFSIEADGSIRAVK